MSKCLHCLLLRGAVEAADVRLIDDKRVKYWSLLLGYKTVAIFKGRETGGAAELLGLKPSTLVVS